MSVCRFCGQDFGLHTCDCPFVAAPKPVAECHERRRYVPPSRAGRIPRADYIASVTVSAEHKAAVHREKQRRYRARKKASA